MTRQEELNEAWCKYMGECSTEIMQALAFALRWADEHPQDPWISVADELPQDKEIVLVLTPDATFWCDVATHINGVEWLETLNGWTVPTKVTHWMPMPAPPKEETKWTEHTLQRDKDGFLVGEVSDLDVYLPFEVHDNKDDTWELIEDGSALVDWSGDIDMRPRYDRIRTMEQVLSNSENIGKDEKGGEE